MRRLTLAQTAFIFLAAALAVAGGASRMEEIAQLVIRLASVLVVAVLVAWPGRFAGPARPLLVMLGLCAALVAIQLVPLPSALWSRLPGRGTYGAATDAAGLAGIWRPISLSPDRGWNSLLSLLVPLAMLCVLARLGQRERFMLVHLLLLLIAISAALGILQLLSGSDWSIYARTSDGAAVGLFANRNHEALLLALGYPLLATWMVEDRLTPVAPRLRLWCGVAGIVTITVLLPATGSRAGLALGGLSILLSLIIARPAAAAALRRWHPRYRRWAIGLAIAAVATLFALALTLSRAVSVQRLMAIDLGEDVRTRLFPRVVDMAQTFFPVGSGFGTFDAAFRRFERLSDLRRTYFNQAHDDFLQVVIEGGLPALVLLVVALVWVSIRSVQAWRGNAERTAVRMARLASIEILLILLASIVDYPLRTPLMMALLAIFAVWVAEQSTADPVQAGGRLAGHDALPA